MSEQKVVFHPLERLDLIDVDALQAQVLEYISTLTGNLLGGSSTAEVSGMLKQPVTVSISNNVNNAYSIGFSDFVMVTNAADSTVPSSRKSQVVVYDASDSFHGDCDFATVRTTVQNYYNNNGQLPFKPSDPAINYGEAQDGQYYPYIWAKAAEVDTTSGNRRFWSIADGFEVTQNVVTRRKFGVNFLVQKDKPAANLGNYVKIARIEEWTLNGASVQLNSSGIKFIYVADGLVPLPDRGNGSPLFYSAESRYNESDYGGLMGATRILAKELDDMRGVGTFDANWGISTTNRSLNPLLSMDGLYDAIEKLDERARNTDKKVSCLIESNMLIQNTIGYFNVSVDHAVNNQNSDVAYITPTAFADFKGYEALVAANTQNVSFPFDPAVSYNLTHDMKYTGAMSVYGIDFGAAYNGYHISGTIEPVSSIVDNESNKYYDWMSGNTTNAGASWPTTPELADMFEPHTCFFLSDTQGGSSSELLVVAERTGKNASGADITYHGIRFGVTNLRRLARVQNLMATWGLKLKFRVNLTLTKPTEA